MDASFAVWKKELYNLIVGTFRENGIIRIRIRLQSHEQRTFLYSSQIFGRIPETAGWMAPKKAGRTNLYGNNTDEHLESLNKKAFISLVYK